MFTGNVDWSKIILYLFCLLRPVLFMRIVDDVFQRTFIKPHLIRLETFGQSVPELHRLLSTSESFCSCRSVIEATSCRVDESTCSQRKGWQTKADLCFVSRKSRKIFFNPELFCSIWFFVSENILQLVLGFHRGWLFDHWKMKLL